MDGRIRNRVIIKDPSKREKITFTNIDRFKPLLYADLFIPSWVNGYSIGMEFMYNYFLAKFPDHFFRTIHIAGKTPYDDFRRFEVGQLAKRENPACVIQSSIQYDFNDNTLDLNFFGVDEYIKRSKWQRSFFKDPEHKLYIGHDMEMMLINFNIRTRYDTRAQQLDAYNRMRKLFRIGCSETIDTDMDIHIPYELMVTLARRAGFETDNENNSIIDPWNFTIYLNQHSQMPILYKLRYINSRYEFFIRMRNLPIHLDLTNALDADDGEQSGQTMINYGIEMQVVMRLPIPKVFLFYNEGKWPSTIEVEPDNGINVYSMRVYDIPEVNYKGWPMYGHSNYLAEKDEKIVESIDITELFKAPVDVKIMTSLDDLITDSINQYIDPSAFIDIAVYTNDLSINNNGRLPIEMDWKNRKIILPQNTLNNYFYIAIYIDRLYVNEKAIQINQSYKNRVAPSPRISYEKDTHEAYIKDAVIEKEKYKGNAPKS